MVMECFSEWKHTKHTDDTKTIQKTTQLRNTLAVQVLSLFSLTLSLVRWCWMMMDNFG